MSLQEGAIQQYSNGLAVASDAIRKLRQPLVELAYAIQNVICLQSKLTIPSGKKSAKTIYFTLINT